MDDQIRNKITELVSGGVRRLCEMRRHLSYFVENELFAGQSSPPVTDARYWPSSKTIMNCMYRAVGQQRFVYLCAYQIIFYVTSLELPFLCIYRIMWLKHKAYLAHFTDAPAHVV